MEMMKIIDNLSNSEKLEKLIEKEVNKIIDKNDLTPVELDNLKKVVCLIKDISELEQSYYESDSMNPDYSSGFYQPIPMNYSYSNANMSRRSGNYMKNSSRSMMNPVYGNGRSGHSIKDRMIDRLESMMDEAQTDYERQQIMDMINQIQH